MTGKPVIKGTRIPVDLILRKLAQKMDIEEILRDYPRLTKKAIQAAIWYAGMIIAEEDVYPLSP